MLKDLRLDTPTSKDPAIIRNLRFLRFLIPLHRTLSLSMLESSDAMKAFSKINMSDFEVYLSFGVGDSGNQRSDFFSLLGRLVTRHPLADLSPILIHKLIEQTKLDDTVQVSSVGKIIAKIALRAKIDGLNPDLLNEYFLDNSLGTILKHTAKAILFLEVGEKNSSLDEINCAIRLATHDMLEGSAFVGHLYQVKGDATYYDNPELAKKPYEISLKNSIVGSFEHAWSCWKLGLLKDSADKLEQAATSFRNLEYIDMWSRALGARGALLIR